MSPAAANNATLALPIPGGWRHLSAMFAAGSREVRTPAVAGTFYPAGPTELHRTVDRFLAEARSVRRAATCPKAIVAPHAGYVFSGAGAARAFALLEPFADRIERVVVIGPAHRVRVEGIVEPDARRLATPLGTIDVDGEAIARTPGIEKDARAHAQEHSIEVELPFLQKVAPKAKVVPLAVGRCPPDRVAAVLDALWGGPETVFVVSSDLSHYLPYEEGRARDTETAARIVALDPTIDGDEACGAAGLNGFLRLASAKRMRAELIDLRSSGDVPEGRGRGGVVGYGAFAFTESAEGEA
jgi:MEMO1 family protein